MQNGKITLNYIPKNNSVTAIVSTLTDFFFIDDDGDECFVDSYMIIDNVFKPIRQYPEEINQENIKRCKPKSILKVITEVIDTNEAEGIIINDFDIDLDTIKNEIIPLAIKSNTMISINSFIEEDIEEKISIKLREDHIQDISDEE